MRLKTMKRYRVNRGDLLPTGKSTAHTVLSGRSIKSINLACGVGDVVEVRVYSKKEK